MGARVVRLLDDSGNLLGILPFALSRRSNGPLAVRQLEWPLADLGCPDHLDVPVVSASAATAVVQALREVQWDVLHLESLAENAPGAQRFAAALAEHGYRVEWTPGEVCPYLDLPSSWDSYLASLSPTRRQTIRRKERALFREHAAMLVDYPADRLDAGWSHLLRLHHQQRQHGSAFGPNEAELQRAFAADLATQGRVWLTTLDVAGTPVAAWYGFAAGDSMCFYQSGRDPAWEHASVGQVLMGMMIRRAIEQGFRTFDFLRGDEPYKMTWTSTLRRDRILLAYRPGVRGALARQGEALARAARRAKRALRSGRERLKRSKS
jgi:CelD/BcsL family acetyltransferase involved in cellulose biosynthesis